jgi:hypothetical protein
MRILVRRLEKDEKRTVELFRTETRLADALQRVFEGEKVQWAELGSRGVPGWHTVETDSMYVVVTEGDKNVEMEGPDQLKGGKPTKGKAVERRAEKPADKGKNSRGAEEGDEDVEMDEPPVRETRKRRRDGESEEVSAKRKRVVSPKEVPSHHLEEEVVASGSTGKKTGKGRKYTSTPATNAKEPATKTSSGAYKYNPQDDEDPILYTKPCSTCVAKGRTCYFYKGRKGLAQSGTSCAYCRLKKGKCDYSGKKEFPADQVTGGAAAAEALAATKATRKKTVAPSSSPASAPPKKSAALPSKRAAPPPSKRGGKSAPPPSKRGGKSAPPPTPTPVPSTPASPPAVAETAPRTIIKLPPAKTRSKNIRVPAAEPGEVHRKLFEYQSHYMHLTHT